ncbi:MAG: M14 family zinc carboxypeptidase [Robiginitalea sp.]|uniref:M14 family metallopeptidase n=1 Tax=Robiginitalea sp. TaxID=1902411 RepID=UPI003C75A1BB
MGNNILKSSLVLLAVALVSCKNTEQAIEEEPAPSPTGYQGQGPNPIVPTVDRPVQRQWKGVWAFNDSTTFFTNDFEGGRLNGVAYDGNDHYTAWITAENTPINVSPWYAFKVWTTSPREITVQLSYQDSRSRYYPKISTDGVNFKPLDSLYFKAVNPGEGEFGIKAAPEFAEITLQANTEPLIVSAQELYTSARVKSWVDSLSQKSFVSNYPIGRTREKRPLHLMEIKENEKGKKAVMVIARQHPPEVTGFLAMKSFIETLSGDSDQARAFRKDHTVFVAPLMNPDGVDNGHWRHNMGGIDLNRDWQNFNQPETRSVRDFLRAKDADYEFVFGVDFHSTWDDIYYPLDTVVAGSKGQIVFDWIQGISQRLPQKKTNISASDQLEPTMVSRTYFFVNHNMPAIVFELGDDTPRDFLKLKGQVAAEELMRLLMEE